LHILNLGLAEDPGTQARIQVFFVDNIDPPTAEEPRELFLDV